MTFAAIALLALIVGLWFFDYATLRKRGRRMLVLEAVVFAGGAFLVASPDTATQLAHLVGIGRGVDFVLYPVVIWLVRESLVSRHRRLEDAERLTQLVRAHALHTASPAAPADGDPRDTNAASLIRRS